MKVPLGSFSNIRTGDCIVTFSRHKIYKLKVVIDNLVFVFVCHEICRCACQFMFNARPTFNIFPSYIFLD